MIYANGFDYAVKSVKWKELEEIPEEEIPEMPVEEKKFPRWILLAIIPLLIIPALK